MAISKQERHNQEGVIFSCRAEAGLQQLRLWLLARRDALNEQWMSLTGDELLRMQGEAELVKRQIKMIEQGPTIKEIEK